MTKEYNMKQLMIRTFHAVGHGCYCTETFKDGKKVVFDCGGKTKSIIERAIKSSIDNNFDLFALCISHFDRDHINGLPFLLNRCKSIKNLWIPYLNDDEKILLIFDYCSKLEKPITEADELCINLINSPESVESDKIIKIIKVLPIDSKNDSFINDESNSRIQIIPSNTALNQVSTTDNDSTLNWFYVPLYNSTFNYREEILNDIKTNPLFKNFFNTNGKFESKFFINIIKSNYKNVVSELRKFLKDYGYSNEHSMMLYSGDGFDSYAQYISGNMTCTYCCSDCNRAVLNKIKWNNIAKSGCLYFGDYNAKKFFKANKHLLSHYLQKCDIIQCPHHGSKDSFNIDILSYDFNYVVIFHDTNDRYNNPSILVCEQILMNAKKVIHITENTSDTTFFVCK